MLVMRTENAMRRHNSSMSSCARAVNADGIDDLGVGMLPRVPAFHAQHRGGGYIHDASATLPVEAADQRDLRAVAIDQPRAGGIDARVFRQLQREHLAFGDSPLIGNARKLADRQLAVVDDRAFGTQAAERCTAPAQISEVGCRLGVVLDRAGRGKQSTQFDKRRRGAAALLRGSLKKPILIPEAKRADAARVIDRPQIIERVQRRRIYIFARLVRLLAAFGMVALDDLASPAIRLAIRDRRMKDGAV